MELETEVNSVARVLNIFVLYGVLAVQKEISFNTSAHSDT